MYELLEAALELDAVALSTWGTSTLEALLDPLSQNAGRIDPSAWPEPLRAPGAREDLRRRLELARYLVKPEALEALKAAARRGVRP